MTRKQKRLSLIAAGGLVIALAVGLVSFALRDNIVFFYSPTELAARASVGGARLRVGGLVKQDSLQREGGQTVRFVVTDTKHDVPVTYTGLLPDLFREGQGVVAEGALRPDGLFHADSVLAKHDERYMPREVADALKAQGVWQEGRGPGQGGAQAAPAGGK
ncbi:cytochrome c maturation protein CcmE [Methylocella sp.]|uniref:cytochrome c maturation protein CcmE n=1 Tax=Methylocella sp. TaxID=1978226 RepID=UPI003783B291